LEVGGDSAGGGGRTGAARRAYLRDTAHAAHAAYTTAATTGLLLELRQLAGDLAQRFLLLLELALLLVELRALHEAAEALPEYLTEALGHAGGAGGVEHRRRRR